MLERNETIETFEAIGLGTRENSAKSNAATDVIKSPSDVLSSLVQQCDSYPSVVSVAYKANSQGQLFQWLRKQPFQQKVAWSNRQSDDRVVCVGEAIRIGGAEEFQHDSVDDVIKRGRSTIRSFVSREKPRAFGGFCFDISSCHVSDDWRNFGSSRFTIPRVLWDGELLSCVVTGPSDKAEALRTLEELVDVEDDASATQVPHWVERFDLPEKEAWSQSVEESLDLFRREALEKVVLARRATFRFESQLNPIDLIRRLSDGTHDCYHFCFQLDDQLAFLGATPERLFKRSDNLLQSEAIAGTRPRGQDSDEDKRLAAELLASEKDQLEHHIVRKFIRQQLHRYVDSLSVSDQASVLKLARKQHLYSGVEASLKESVTDGQLVDRLHPTPAVGGYPTENAIQEIARLEPFNRGWYAAPVGWISEAEAEFAVAIRSGLLHGKSLSLYSGAGIVPGSTADREWDEIEHKLADFLEIIGS